VKHVPGRFLGYFNVPVKLHARYAFQVGNEQVDGEYPLAIGNAGLFDVGSSPDAEIVPAVVAPVGHGLVVCRYCVRASAVSALAAILPHDPLKPFHGRCFIGKHFGQPHQRYAFPETFAWTF